MELPANVRTKPTLPNWLKRIPLISLLFNQTAQGVFGNIYMPKEVINDLKSQHPSPYNVSLLIHEEIHLNRQRKVGCVKWIINYIFLPKFRLKEELIARKEQMRYIKMQKLSYPFEQQAKFLSSWVYLWPADYISVLKELKRNWEEL